MLRTFIFHGNSSGVAHFNICNIVHHFLCTRKNFIFFAIVFFSNSISAQINSQLNIVWNSQSKNAAESMPTGGGDIGMNVWAENGDIYAYIARSGNFNEDNALFKTGRVKITLNPNPFTGKNFKQELHLQEGFITLSANNNGLNTVIKIWADVESPVAHFEVLSNKKVMVNAAYESWRYKDRIIDKKENFANSYKWAPPKNLAYKADSISFINNEVWFYHYNSDTTIFDKIVAQQGLESVKAALFNPLKKLAFGGIFYGNSFIADSIKFGIYENTDFKSWSIKSKFTNTHHHIKLLLYNKQVENITTWKNEIEKIKTSYNQNKNDIYNNEFWKNYWQRSFIILDKKNAKSKSWEIGRNYNLFRYMLAFNKNGIYPTKFNGGLLTVDPVYTDTAKQFTPDYRNWGGGLHTAQNQRLVYFPMIKNGDWDILQPQLKFYLSILKNAELRSKIYWNHSGACFTEQMENFGLPNFAEYGTKRPAEFDKGVEYNKWLEYSWDTALEFCLMMLEEQLYTNNFSDEKLKFIESCIVFFDEHYQYENIKKTGMALDENGKLVLYPTSGAETYKLALNSTSTIAALSCITNRILELPTTYLSNTKKEYFKSFLNRIPNISFGNFNGKTTIAPAKNWARINNTESPQLYPVFPWHLYGLNKQGLDTALNTFYLDTNVVKFRSHIGWKQDNIWAANLGLKKEAWELTSKKLQNGNLRFPAFWGPGYDWLPDFNWGGSGIIGLQDMLLQVDNKKIFLFPAWDKNKDVRFKLHAPYNTTIEAELENGKLIYLNVVPKNRLKDVVVNLF